MPEGAGNLEAAAGPLNADAGRGTEDKDVLAAAGLTGFEFAFIGS